GAQGAVDAGELHVHQTGSQRREGAVTGDLQAIGQQVQLAEPADELGGVVGLVPCLGEAVDLGGQRARRGPGVELLAGDVLEEGEVVGGAGQQLGGGGGRGVGPGDHGAGTQRRGALGTAVRRGLTRRLSGLRGPVGPSGVGRGGIGRGREPFVHGVSAGHQETLSMMRARPWPPPTHRVARPNWPSRSRRPLIKVVVMRAPVEPQGWPSAIAPPWTLSLSWSMPRSSADGMTCAAKASFSSTRSMSSMPRPALVSARRVDSTGPRPMISGLSPETPVETILARGVMPRSRA